MKKCTQKGKGARIAKTVLKRGEKLEDSHYPISRFTHKVIIIEYDIGHKKKERKKKRHTYRSREQNSPEIRPCKYSQLIFDKCAKATL